MCRKRSRHLYPQEYEKSFGAIEVLRKMKSSHKDAKSELVKEKENVVKAEEISSLQPLHFYLKVFRSLPAYFSKK